MAKTAARPEMCDGEHEILPEFALVRLSASGDPLLLYEDAYSCIKMLCRWRGIIAFERTVELKDRFPARRCPEGVLGVNPLEEAPCRRLCV